MTTTRPTPEAPVPSKLLRIATLGLGALLLSSCALPGAQAAPAAAAGQTQSPLPSASSSTSTQ